MAHLEVEPRPRRPLWLWILLVIILIALGAMLFKKCYSDRTGTGADTTEVAGLAPMSSSTGPDWKNVDFYAGETTDADITDKDIRTSGNGTYTIYTIGENILFASGGNDVSPNGQAKLKTIGEVLSRRFEGATIGVFGSTDSTGTADENIKLGQQRAEAVKNWLETHGKVPSDHISVQSLGESEPVATNVTKEGREKNRNVSIVVFPKQ